jgi:hypothetical protein
MRAQENKSLVSSAIFSAPFSREKNIFSNNEQREAHQVSLHVELLHKIFSTGFDCD